MFVCEVTIAAMPRNVSSSRVLLFNASFSDQHPFIKLLFATLKVAADSYPLRLFEALLTEPLPTRAAQPNGQNQRATTARPPLAA